MSKIDIPDVDGLDVSFGTTKGLPPMSSIPKEFIDGNTKWNKLFSAWFYGGLKSLTLTANEGVDMTKAKHHIRALMVSFDPKHEHKAAGVAYLMSKYFANAEWEKS